MIEKKLRHIRIIFCELHNTKVIKIWKVLQLRPEVTHYLSNLSSTVFPSKCPKSPKFYLRGKKIPHFKEVNFFEFDALHLHLIQL